MRRFQHHAGEGFHRIEPAAMDRNIEFTRIGPVNRQPIDEFRVRRAAQPVEQGFPCI